MPEPIAPSGTPSDLPSIWGIRQKRLTMKGVVAKVPVDWFQAPSTSADSNRLSRAANVQCKSGHKNRVFTRSRPNGEVPERPIGPVSKTEVSCVARPVANVPCDILLASACRLLVHGLPPLPGERAVFSVPRRRATPRPATQTGLRCDTFFKACVGVSDRPRKTSPADSAAEKDHH